MRLPWKEKAVWDLDRLGFEAKAEPAGSQPSQVADDPSKYEAGDASQVEAEQVGQGHGHEAQKTRTDPIPVSALAAENCPKVFL